VCRPRSVTRESHQAVSSCSGHPLGFDFHHLAGPCEWCCQIVKEGTERDFNERINAEWLAQTQPILDAFWHTKYFLSMMAKYGKQLENAPGCMPSGYALPLLSCGKALAEFR
jgi:hypothetical protein